MPATGVSPEAQPNQARAESVDSDQTTPLETALKFGQAVESFKSRQVAPDRQSATSWLDRAVVDCDNALSLILHTPDGVGYGQAFDAHKQATEGCARAGKHYRETAEYGIRQKSEETYLTICDRVEAGERLAQEQPSHFNPREHQLLLEQQESARKSFRQAGVSLDYSRPGRQYERTLKKLTKADTDLVGIWGRIESMMEYQQFLEAETILAGIEQEALNSQRQNPEQWPEPIPINPAGAVTQDRESADRINRNPDQQPGRQLPLAS